VAALVWVHERVNGGAHRGKTAISCGSQLFLDGKSNRMSIEEWKLSSVSNREPKIFQCQEKNEHVFRCQIRNNLQKFHDISIIQYIHMISQKKLMSHMYSAPKNPYAGEQHDELVRNC
jgi:hypothetical protein